MRKIFLSGLVVILFSCSSKQQADLIVHNAVVYSVDSSFSIAQSFAARNGKILEVGSDEKILGKYKSDKVIDAFGKPVYPGFIDAHCHFYSYGIGLQRMDLVGTKSFDEVVQRILGFQKEHPLHTMESKSNDPPWIVGRGWDQNDWAVKEFPDRRKLDSIFPYAPVMLKRVDGHAVLVNGAALKKAGITADTKVDGGIVEVKNGFITGILVDNAIELVAKIIPGPGKSRMINALMDAQKNCFAVGLTTVDDAGTEKTMVELMDSLQKTGELKMRIYAMLASDTINYDHYFKTGKYKTDLLNVCSFKFFADGALGSRGACLLKPYSDRPQQQGFLLSTEKYFRTYAQKMADAGFQMNTHCIGDSSDRLLLDIYGSVLKGKNDKRWRIEHAQVIDKNDFSKFNMYSIIPSVQPTHATSDMYWAKDRLGEERIKGAYAYKQLLLEAGVVALGTDFPVENINPLYTFYAAVARQDLKGFPDEGFQMKNALSREETLKGMTIWAAYSNFEEKEKGSLVPGKFADFVILDNDIMKMDLRLVPQVNVLATYVNGEKVYSKGE